MQVDSIEECWKSCEEKEKDCKAISFYIPTSQCQFFKTDSPAQIYDRQFRSYTTKKGFFLTQNIAINF